MKDVRDVTSTVFGLFIAYLLPGLTAFYSLSFWCRGVEDWFNRVLNGNASVGLIMFIIFGAIIIGLQLQIVRSLIFEHVICRRCRFDPKALSGISEAGTLAAFRLVIDEQLRYHQFWGAMSLAQLPLFYGWIRTERGATMPIWLFILFGVLYESVTIYGAIAALRRYAAVRNMLSSTRDA